MIFDVSQFDISGKDINDSQFANKNSIFIILGIFKFDIYTNEEQL